MTSAFSQIPFHLLDDHSLPFCPGSEPGNFTVSFLLVLFTAPAFQGQLISPAMRQNIPQEYLETFAFFRAQDPTAGDPRIDAKRVGGKF